MFCLDARLSWYLTILAKQWEANTNLKNKEDNSHVELVWYRKFCSHPELECMDLIAFASLMFLHSSGVASADPLAPGVLAECSTRGTGRV